MTYSEFFMKLKDGVRKPTEKEFEVIDFVYKYHPSICHRTDGKEKIAMLYTTFGMRIIYDMRETTKRAQEIEQERRELRRRLEELEREAEELYNA